MRALRIHYKRFSFQTKRVRHLYGGLPLLVELRDPDSAGWYDHDWEPLPEIEFLKQYGLISGAKLFDIGAHQGVVAMMLASVTAPGIVVAVEGNEFNATAAKQNVAINALPNIHVIHGAAAAKPGELWFTEDSNGKVHNAKSGHVRVRAYSIDELRESFGQPNLLFIDVEGYEVEVLKGAELTLASHPDCFVEVHTGCGLENFGYTPSNVLDFFPRDHYDIFIRPASEAAFSPLVSDDTVPKSRFFMIAVAKR